MDSILVPELADIVYAYIPPVDVALTYGIEAVPILLRRLKYEQIDITPCLNGYLMLDQFVDFPEYAKALIILYCTNQETAKLYVEFLETCLDTRPSYDLLVLLIQLCPRLNDDSLLPSILSFHVLRNQHCTEILKLFRDHPNLGPHRGIEFLLWHFDNGISASDFAMFTAHLNVMELQDILITHISRAYYGSRYIRHLHERGVDIDGVNSKGMNALYNAITHRNTDVIPTLLQYKADPYRLVHGHTAVSHSVHDRYGTTTRCLLKAKVDPNRPNADGTTPVMQARLKGHTDVIKTLVCHGADLSVFK